MIRQRTFANLRIERVHLGISLAEAIAAEVAERGAERVVVVASKTIARQTDVLDPVKTILGDRMVGLYDETQEHVPRPAVIELANYLRETGGDMVVTVGGGTPIDSVKMALLCLAEDVHDVDGIDQHAIGVNDDGSARTPMAGSPPFRQIVAPTTLSGADFSDVGGCVDPVTQIKQLFAGREIGGASIILDPAITLHTPMDLWLSTGVRAMDHAVETVCSPVREPMADAGAFEALRLLGRSLPQTAERPDDLDLRLDSQTGVWLACLGLARVPYGASHGIGHQLGAVAGVPHGYTSTVMLPHVLDYNRDHTADAQGRIAEALGQPDATAGDALRDLVQRLGLPSRLRDVGVHREHFDAIATGGMANATLRANPRPIDSPEQILELLELAY